MAISTIGTYLFYKPTAQGTAVKLCDIISYPDLGSTPSKLDTTDLSAMKYKTSILGLQETPDLTFEANYDETAYKLIDGLKAKYDFELHFGTAGADGKFTWNGEVQVYITGGGVDEVRKMTIICGAGTEIVNATT